MYVALITIAMVLIAYGAVSRPLGARGVSGMVFTAAGLCVGASALKLVNIQLEGIAAERFCELTLVFLLFSDSTRIELRVCAGIWAGRPAAARRLAAAMLAGLGAGLLVLPGIPLASAFVLSTMVCPTDAALGQRVVSDKSLPPRVRQALDVESGLNDGVAVPFFLVAVDLSLARLSTGVTVAVVRNMAEQIGLGLVAGIKPARWRACCSAPRMIAGGWRDSRGRSCPSWRRCSPTLPPSGWAAAASSRPSPGG